jgi:hypothetical protein
MTLALDPTLGRVTRHEPWQDLTVSTYRRIQDAIREDDHGLAGDYIDYFHDEALVCKRLYDQWLGDLRPYFVKKKLGEALFESSLDKVLRTIAPAGQSRWDRIAGWQHYVDLKDSLLVRLDSGRSAAADLLVALAAMKEAWRVSHDNDVDTLLGLFDVVVDRLGEESIGELWEQHLVREWFDKRYARFDVSKADWKESFKLLVFLSFEAMHGHLCGPGREGDVGYKEFEDRVELEFDPCGSGGRALRGDEVAGTPSRMEAPYKFKAVEGAYDFTWNKKGICTYCAHCCVLTELMPAKEFGYPVRVIDPPSYPHEANAKCRYTIYKDPRTIPAEIYERLGLTKPAADQPLGSAHGPFGRDVREDSK